MTYFTKKKSGRLAMSWIALHVASLASGPAWAIARLRLGRSSGLEIDATIITSSSSRWAATASGSGAPRSGTESVTR
ncbi:hypothetical protein B0H16DRAFT_634340 [Mycena metata]|uniref:Uncharacterized protein n=1 Tax=Mycena metata TaxID=1033252 RepID=A0AAD7NFW9_9AGAR|nr:hypothetical protein B0H16DRAFT_634340 [Mycena metata]